MRWLQNPEWVRNVRAQLRPGRMLTAAVICGVVSFVAGIATRIGAASGPPGWWGLELMGFAVGAQAFVLVVGGGLACVHAIQREKDTNTFDYQRVTRLSPLELALGKLLGAPAIHYFIAICLLPAAVIGAVVGGASPVFVVAGYVVLVLGTLCYHALALLLSLIVERGAATVAVLGFLAVLLFPAPLLGVLAMGPITPFMAGEVMRQTAWVLEPDLSASPAPRLTDLFFGYPVHHVPVLIVLYVTFAAWFLLAVVRNIKRDPAVYELYRPGQALGLALSVNLVLVSFLRSPAWNSLEAHLFVLGVNAALFLMLGLALLRNRDRVRRLLRADRAEPAWLTASFPAPYIAGGAVLVALGAAAAALLQVAQRPDASWNLAFAVFAGVFVAAWVTRDVLFLQWMNLRRGRRRVLLGLLYLAVAYASVYVLFTTFALGRSEPAAVLFATVLPGYVLTVSPYVWTAGQPLWMLALLAQAGLIALLIGRQRRTIAELAPAAP